MPAVKAALLCLLLGGSAIGYVYQKNQIIELGKQPMHVSLYYYNYVVRPSSAGNNELKLTTSFLFPALEKR